MIVAFDTSTLIFLFRPDAPGPFLPGSKERVDACQARITHLLSELQKNKARIVIPTPSLAELLTHAGNAGSEWLRILSTSKHFLLSPFDVIAAVECADMSRRRLSAKKASQPRQKAKFDEQIVAIALVEGATVIYSDDEDIGKLVGDRAEVKGMADIPLPPQEAQGSLIFDPEASDPDASENME